MSARPRRTIAQSVTLSGVGLHMGDQCELTFRPGARERGIIFRRIDRDGAPEIAAHVDHAVEAQRRTQLGTGEDALHTVEHVLAAVAGLEIDDVVIEMSAAEPPILDGSAEPFVAALRDAGVVEHGGESLELRIAEPVRVIDGESVYEAFPSDRLELEVAIDFPHPLIGRQSGRYVVTPETFREELAAARTFGFVREVDALRTAGLIRGASLDNAVVLDEQAVISEGTRWPDEFVRHKALDCVGDLALAGRRVRARIVAHKPSHRGTVTLVRELVRHAVPHGSTRPTTTLPMKLGIEEIMAVIPHRYPFLLVDRVIELEPKVRVVGLKNVTINEPFFQGHFPGHPIMPGVLIIEAMAQVGAMLLMGAMDDPGSKVAYFMSLDNVKFRRPVKPGDQLRLELDVVQIRGPVCRLRGVAKVDGDIVCEADMAAMIRDR